MALQPAHVRQQLAKSGSDMYTMSVILGHSSTEMTKRYAHLSEDFNQSAVDRLDDFKIKGTPKRTPTKQGKLSN